MIKLHPAREKISLHLPAEIVRKLEEMIFYARQDAPRGESKGWTKSNLATIALEGLINEYEKSDGTGKEVIQSIIYSLNKR